jgi:hypothetical protein
MEERREGLLGGAGGVGTSEDEGLGDGVGRGLGTVLDGGVRLV